MHSHYNVFRLSSSYIQKNYAVILNMKKEDIILSSYQKCQFPTSVPLQNYMSGQQDSLSLWHADKKIVMDVTEKNIISQFQVGYISFPALKQHNIFR